MTVLWTAGIFSGETSTIVLSVPFLLLSIAAIAFLSWKILQSVVLGRCPRCRNSLVDSGTLSLRHPSWCYECGLLLRPERLDKNKDEWYIEFDEMLSERDRIVKWLSMLMQLSIMDRVDELTLEPGDADYRAFVRIGDGHHELEPPSRVIHRQLAAAARAIWNCSDHADAVASATKRVRILDLTATVKATFTPMEFGEIVSFSFVHHGQPTALSA